MTQDISSLLDQAHAISQDYASTINDRRVGPSQEDLNALQAFHHPLPEQSTKPSVVIEKLGRLGSPATMATTGPRFFGYVVGGALPVTIAAAQIAAAWDQNAGAWALAPIAAELEDVSAKWMLDLIDLPRDATVGFVTGSTMGTFSAVAAARAALLKNVGWNVKTKGLNGAPPLRVVTSEEIHPTNTRALGYAGIGLDQVERVPTDDQGRIRVDAMPELDDRTLVMLQAGNINSGAFDDFQTIIPKARAAGAWTHIDGAFGLWARASTTRRHLTNGVELADSWSIDGHKWLNLPQDNAIYAVRNAEAIADVFQINTTYLFRTERREPNTLTPELSRRARGIEFWAALATLGREGVAEIIDRGIALAALFADGLREIGYEVLNDVTLNQVVFRLATKEATQRAMQFVQEEGVLWLGPTTWQGKEALRISVSSAATREEDVKLSLESLKRAKNS